MKIDKNIPIPNPRLGNRGASSKYGSTILKMETGDSVLVDNATEAKSFTHAMASRGVAYTARKVDEGYRVWRTK